MCKSDQAVSLDDNVVFIDDEVVVRDEKVVSLKDDGMGRSAQVISLEQPVNFPADKPDRAANDARRMATIE